jgi:hypothetical protein
MGDDIMDKLTIEDYYRITFVLVIFIPFIIAILYLAVSGECYFCEKRKMFFGLHMTGNLSTDEWIETCNTAVCKKCVREGNLTKEKKDYYVVHNSDLKGFEIVTKEELYMRV